MLTLLLDLERSEGMRQKRILFLAEALERSDRFKPLICCPEGSFLADEARKSGFEVFALKSESPSGIANRLRLWLFQRKQEKLLIHSFGGRAHELAHIIRKMRRPDNAILVQTIFSGISRDKPFKTAPFVQADKITCGSTNVLNLAARAGLDPSRMMIIRPGYAIPADRSAYYKAQDRFIFMTYGGLSPGCGHSLLVKSMAAMWQRSDLPPWEVRIFGSGPLFQSILDEAFSLGVSDRLALLGDQKAEAVLGLGDVMLVPSVGTDGNGEAICLGWLFGLAVICSDLPVHMEQVRQEENALAVTPDDPQALASAMIRLMQQEDLRQYLIEGGERMLPLISSETMVEGFLKLYSGLVAGRGWVLPVKKSRVIEEKPTVEDIGAFEPNRLVEPNASALYGDEPESTPPTEKREPAEADGNTPENGGRRLHDKI